MLLGPAEYGEGEQAGGEPGVEHVGFLCDGRAAALRASLRSFARDGDLAAGDAVPCGNAVSPPELAGDAPVVNVAHPVEIGFRRLRGREFDVALLDGGDGFVGERLDFYEPLRGKARLYHCLAAVAFSDGERVFRTAPSRPCASRSSRMRLRAT